MRDRDSESEGGRPGALALGLSGPEHLLADARRPFHAAARNRRVAPAVPSAGRLGPGGIIRAMSLIPHTRLGPYEILEPLGSGGMGDVYRARDTRLGRDVAVKVLPERFADDRVAMARFEREAKAVAALSHPNIMAIFDIGREGPLAYLVTELLEGETLRQRLTRGALPARKAAEYGAQIALALGVAHEKGLIHRDVKPENVFIAPGGRVKVLDFGLARPIEPAPPEGSATVVVVTEPGLIAGTPAYMAPEQAAGRLLDHRADIFALGTVLFEMLTGQRAFHGETTAHTLMAVIEKDPPDVSTLDPTIPVAMAQLVRHCLEKEPAERFQSARDVAFNLQLLAGGPTGSGPAGPGEQPPVGRRWLRRPALALIGLVTTAAAALAGAWFIGPRMVTSPVFHQVSYRQEAIFRAAIGPDRQTIVYSTSDETNVPEIVSLVPGWPNAKPIGVPASHLLSISSKGELALLTHARIVTTQTIRGTLATLPLGSSQPRELLDNVREASWAPDGAQLAIVRVVDGGKDRLEFPIGRKLYESSGYLTDLRVSPAGDAVVFFEHPVKWEDEASLILMDRNGQMKVLAGPYESASGIAWRPGGKEVVFSARASASENSAIYSVPPGGTPRLVLATAGGLTIHDISPDGQWLVSRDDVRRAVLTRTAGMAAERDLTWLNRSDIAAIAADGSRVLFTEYGGPAGSSGGVCLRATDGSPTVVLGTGSAQDLSPDGRWVVAIDYMASKLWLYPTGAGEKRDLARGAIERYRYANWFRDGGRVLVCGNERGRSARCYVQDVAGGPPRAVTPDGDWGIPSPDGRRAVVWRADARPAIYPFDGTPGITVPSSTIEDVPVGWGADGQAVLVYQPGRVPGVIERIDLATGARQFVRQFEAPSGRVGVLSVDPVVVADDKATSYAYTATQRLSTLFVVRGLR